MSLRFVQGSADRVVIDPTNANINAFTAFTMIALVYPVTFTAKRQVFRKDTLTQPSFTLKQLRIFGTAESPANALNGYVGRATTAAQFDTAANTMTYDAWQWVALTYDESNSVQAFRSLIDAPLVEASYSFRDAGTGATLTDGTTLFIGNSQSASPVNGFSGRMALFTYMGVRLTLGELHRWQRERSHLLAPQVTFELGKYGTGVQVDETGGGNNSTAVVGVTVDDDPPPLVQPTRRFWGEPEAVAVASFGTLSLMGVGR
jgi:hypothetical protein